MTEVDEVVRALRAGKLAILPTDTVYGLVCSSSHREPAADLYRLKGRAAIQPTAVVVASVEALPRYLPELDARVLAIARALLPGPYTLVVSNPARRFAWLTEGQPGTLGLRVPALSGVAAEVVRHVGAVVATSANLPGGPDPRRLAEVPPEILAGRRGRRRRRRAAGNAVHRDRRHRRRAGDSPGWRRCSGHGARTHRRHLGRTAVPRASASSFERGTETGCSSIGDAMADAVHSFARLRAAGLAEIDPDIAALLGDELERQRNQIELIASENFTWPSILEAVGSVPTNKYAEGYPGKRYYGGCEIVDQIEQLAIDRAKALFGAEHANVQPHAGAQANMAVYLGLMQPGDTVLSLRLDHGGHLTHGLKVNFSGRLYTIVHYGVSRETSVVDYDEVMALAKEHRPKVILCGGSAYPRTVETWEFRKIADEVGALLWCDMAHFSGLVAAGLHPNPVPDCDVVTSTTHKTLAGPRAGFILCREEHASAIDRAIFPGLQGGPLEHAIAAKATCFKIAASEPFRDYQTSVRANADALAAEIMDGGLEVLTGGTDTHLLQLDLRRTEWTGKDAEERLHDVKLTTNRNTVPFDERPPTIASGVRIGTPAATMRGFDEDDFREVGKIIVGALDDGADVPALAARSEALCAKRPLYEGFRGYTGYEA